ALHLPGVRHGGNAGLRAGMGPARRPALAVRIGGGLRALHDAPHDEPAARPRAALLRPHLSPSGPVPARAALDAAAVAAAPLALPLPSARRAPRSAHELGRSAHLGPLRRPRHGPAIPSRDVPHDARAALEAGQELRWLHAGAVPSRLSLAG